jgi:hypothetical protein
VRILDVLIKHLHDLSEIGTIVCTQHGGAEENYKNLNQGGRSTSQDMNSIPPEYETGLLTTLWLGVFNKAT